ncbi:MAG: hypothetical protein P4L16_03870 [Chlamydiales bacterium]|nr:hypothetical protein [Chlamydiales bacterium]
MSIDVGIANLEKAIKGKEEGSLFLHYVDDAGKLQERSWLGRICGRIGHYILRLSYNDVFEKAVILNLDQMGADKLEQFEEDIRHRICDLKKDESVQKKLICNDGTIMKKINSVIEKVAIFAAEQKDSEVIRVTCAVQTLLSRIKESSAEEFRSKLVKKINFGLEADSYPFAATVPLFGKKSNQDFSSGLAPPLVTYYNKLVEECKRKGLEITKGGVTESVTGGTEYQQFRHSFKVSISWKPMSGLSDQEKFKKLEFTVAVVYGEGPRNDRGLVYKWIESPNVNDASNVLLQTFGNVIDAIKDRGFQNELRPQIEAAQEFLKLSPPRYNPSSPPSEGPYFQED